MCLLLIRGGLIRALKNVLFVLEDLVRLRMPYQSDPALDIKHPRAVTLPHGVSIALGTLVFLLLEILPAS